MPIGLIACLKRVLRINIMNHQNQNSVKLCVFWIVLPLCVGHGQQAASTASMPPILVSEVEEYTAKRTEGINKLTDVTKAELLAIQEKQMSEGNLEATNAITKAIKHLPIDSMDKAKPLDGIPPSAQKVMTDHASKVFAGISGLNLQFISRLEKVKLEVLKSGNVAGANSVAAQIQKLKNESDKLIVPKTPVGAKKETETNFTVEALIDGNSELHITREGLYWMVPGGMAKPGLHEGAKESTYINGSRWKPKWRVEGERGPDTSDIYPFPINSLKLVVETENVAQKRSGKNENRSPITTKMKGETFVVTIPDPEGGSRWYKLRIKASQ
jgi:hypothetical protein